MKLYFDVETSCFLDLNKVGAIAYFSHESAKLNCLNYAIDDGPVITLDYKACQFLTRFKDLPKYQKDDEFVQAFLTADKVVAHRAEFEIAAMKYLLGLERPLHCWVCTMAKCAYYGYPRGLDEAAKALKCSALKDIQGKAVMMKLAKGLYTPDDCPADFERLYVYGRADIPPMREIDQKLPDLPPEILDRWVCDVEINLRGLPIDLRMVENAIALREYIGIQDNAEMAKLSGGFVQTVGQTDKIVAFMSMQSGVTMLDCTADTVVKTLQTETLTPTARRILELRQESGLSSLAKYAKIQDYQVGGRLYQMFDWYGAHTGRPTGSGPQVMNLPRSEDPEFWADTISNAPQFIYHVSKPAEKLKEGMRGVICCDSDHTFIGMDLAQIEARATGWMAGAQGFLNLFLTTDPYCTYGSKIFGHEITKKDQVKRQGSKATVLAFGFAGGIGAGQRVGTNYKINFRALADVVLPTATPYELVKAEKCYEYYLRGNPLKPLPHDEAIAVDILKQRYRRDFPEIVTFWDQLEQAFLLGGNAGPISVEVKGGGLRILTLPSGRQLFYHGVRISGKAGFDDEDGEASGYSYQGRYGRAHLWKGTLTENCAQAINADISDWFKLRANKIAPVVHHCYDEFTMEVEKTKADWAMGQLKELTDNKPLWCEGLPLGFDYWTGPRYGK